MLVRFALLLACGACAPPGGGGDGRTEAFSSLAPRFTAVQLDLFSAPGGQPNAWADIDADGDLDLFVGFRGAPDRLYRNDGGIFVQIASEAGVAAEEETRAAAWGDYDQDGDLDLYVGFAAIGMPNRLYRNDGSRFTDVAAEVGVAVGGTSRQPAFVDYDGDGDLDLFVAFRDRPNMLFRNDGGRFADVTEASGIGDPRRSVGAAWFDMDGDGDLDVFVANQNGDADGFYRNRGDGTFEDVAPALGMSQPGRAEELGSVGTAVSDYDNDGDLDLFVASYGPDVLWQNQGDGTFVNVAAGTPLAEDHHSVAASWGDFDNDGWLDLYVDTFLSDEVEARDHLFQGRDGAFTEVLPGGVAAKGASHGVAWADFDGDGDLDLALANNHADGTHPLYRNEMETDRAARSLQVLVVDAHGRATRAGATVTLSRAADGFVTTRLVDTGGGYSSQGVGPVHFTWPAGDGPFDLTVTWFEAGSRRSHSLVDVRPETYIGSRLVLEAATDR
jgi:hypothetical protein